MMRGPAARAADLRRSEIRVIFDAAARRPEVIRLEVGEPSFTTPGHIIDAAARAAHDGHTGYGPNGGLLSLRELLVEKLERVDGIHTEPDEVVVTPGGMNALFSTYLALLDRGDHVLLPTPGFPNMDEMVRLVGGRPSFYPLESASGFLPDVDLIESLIGDDTKVLFINTPGNPTGAVFPPSLMEELVDLASRRDLWLLSDEVYDEMILDLDESHTAAAPFDRDGRVITVYSFSKVYAMTGWRVGYAVASGEIAQVLRTLQEPEVSCPSTISQKAAEAALTGPRQPIEDMIDAYRRRRDLTLEAADRSGIRAIPPAGTLYMMLDVHQAGAGDVDFALWLLDEFGVSVAPGSVFGPSGRGWVRISLAAEDDAIVEGVERIAAAVEAKRDVVV